MVKKVETCSAPKAIGPYSQAVCAGNFVFVSGQIPAEPKTGEVVTGNISEQAVQVFENVKAVLSAAGCEMENVVKTTVFMKDMNDFATVNRIYADYFHGEILPARVAVEVARLPKDILIEVEVTAYKNRRMEKE